MPEPKPEPKLRTDDQGQVGRRLGDLVVAAGLISQAQLAQALTEQKRTGEKLGAALARLALVTEEQLVDVLARQYRVPVVKLPEGDIAPEILKLVPATVARKYQVIPIGRRGPTSLILATADPSNLQALDDVAFRTGLKVIQVLATPSAIRQAIQRSYEAEAATLMNVLSEAEALSERFALGDNRDRTGLSVHELRSSADQAPVVRLVNMILLDAIDQAASDVHLEPDENAFRVRFRVDGILQDVMTPPDSWRRR
jgi:type IV pilus assembly protein PilB